MMKRPLARVSAVRPRCAEKPVAGEQAGQSPGFSAWGTAARPVRAIAARSSSAHAAEEIEAKPFLVDHEGEKLLLEEPHLARSVHPLDVKMQPGHQGPSRLI